MVKSAAKRKKASWELDLGANYHSEGTTHFKVWAPHHSTLFLQIEDRGLNQMDRDAGGFFTLDCDAIEPGMRYFYMMENGLLRADPVSRSLPKGLHGSTEVVDPYAFRWQDRDWKGLDLTDAIIYELHVGVYTAQGTFDALIDQLGYFKDLGINCIELMPLAEFPGRFNWGYDGASLYAPFSGYGGSEGLKRFVDACHRADLAVCLDVVYNHFGPEGNYLQQFGPYLSETYHTPWGKALNYDGPYSDAVREYVIKNALYWIVEYHIDMLRLDAIHGIYDFSASPMLSELVAAVKEVEKNLDRKVHVIAESDRNDARVVHSIHEGGSEICALWNDDYHHAAHVALTGEQSTYYSDFNGIEDLAKSLSSGFVYDGKYSAYRKRRHGNSSADLPFEKFIVFLQNHDQIGNRPMGDRLSTLLAQDRLKIAACLTLMTPGIPLLFMGEEYGEKAPFEYFVDYENERLMRSIYEGRKREFHREEMPFPGKESFDNSTLTWKMDEDLFAFYKQLIALHKEHPAKCRRRDLHVYHSVEEEWLAWEYPTHEKKWIGVFIHLGKEEREISFPFKKSKRGASLSFKRSQFEKSSPI